LNQTKHTKKRSKGSNYLISKIKYKSKKQNSPTRKKLGKKHIDAKLYSSKPYRIIQVEELIIIITFLKIAKR